MNWRKITAYAAALFAAQVMLGFLEGSIAPASAGPGILLLLTSSIVSFVLCGSIFAHLAIRQPSKPFSHALAALALQIIVASALAQALTGWLDSTPLGMIILEWLVLLCALLAGTAVGLSIRRSTGQPADA